MTISNIQFSMQKIIIHYIRQQSIKSIRDFILDNDLTESDTLLLHQSDFDNLALEYRQTYKSSIEVPYFLLSVLIREDKTGKVPVNRVGIIREDINRFENDFDPKLANQPDEKFAFETIYRCGWCGNVVDFDGREFDNTTRQFKINILEKYESSVTVKQVSGECCPNKQ